MKVNNWLNSIQSLLYPSGCLLCGAAGDYKLQFCPACYRSLPFNRHTCPICALPLPPSVSSDMPCGRCIKKQPPYTQSFAPLRYESPVSKLISGLKFHRRLYLVEPLARVLTDCMGETFIRPDLIIPVPLHPLRLQERGFNQSLELSRVVARHYRLPVNWQLCQRVRHTQAQSDLSEKARQKNLRSAFEVCGDIQSAHLVLFDDVITTGATVTELSKTLKRAGAKRVDVWAMARTPGY